MNSLSSSSFPGAWEEGHSLMFISVGLAYQIKNQDKKKKNINIWPLTENKDWLTYFKKKTQTHALSWIIQ